MSQVITGLRRVLSSPIVYTSFQILMGARRGWAVLVDDFIRPVSDMKLLDIGCGPADVLGFLSEPIDYWGFDISESYIDRAKKRFGGRGTFRCKLLTQCDLLALPKFDVVLASGVLHHMDDDVARVFIGLAYAALRQGGRLITVDPCWAVGQNAVARFLISKDRGQNVRDAEGYERLVKPIFSSRAITVRHRSWIPYTHCFMECARD